MKRGQATKDSLVLFLRGLWPVGHTVLLYVNVWPTIFWILQTPDLSFPHLNTETESLGEVRVMVLGKDEETRRHEQ